MGGATEAFPGRRRVVPAADGQRVQGRQPFLLPAGFEGEFIVLEKDLDGIIVTLPEASEGEDLSYELPWELAAQRLDRFGVYDAERLVDFTYNFNRVIYWMADGRYHYHPPEQMTMLLPNVGGVELEFPRGMPR